MKPLLLLLENDPDEAELMRHAVREGCPDWDLEVVEDGAAALAFVAGALASGAGPAGGGLRLVLLDLKVPGMGGDEVLRALKQEPRNRALPVLVLTSSELPGDVGRAYGDGANAVLRKPLLYKDLVLLVQALKAFWGSPALLRLEGG